MIDEDVLRGLLRDATDSVPPPGRAPEKLAAQLTRPSAPAPPGRRRQRAGAVLKVAAVILVLFGLVAGLGALGNSSSQHASTNAGGVVKDVGSSIPREKQARGDVAAAPTTAPANQAAPQEPKASPPTDGAKIVKTGSIEIEVGRGRFERTVTLITTKVVGLGGYVKESSTSESSAEPSGSLTVRVPVDSYEELLADLRELGKVGSVTSKGTDVTAQFTDLQARLDALVATRDRLSAVLAQASTVGDILAVQDRITQVQTEIERLQGQQKVLEDQASFGTVAIALGEPGSEVRSEPEKKDDGRGLGQAWDDARRRFGDGIEGIVAWSGPIAIILIVGVILFVLGRLGWVVVRRFTM